VKTSDYPRLALGGAVVAILLWIASRKVFFADTVSSPFLAIALLSVFLILLRTCDSWKECVGVGVLFLALAGLDLRVLGYPASWPVWASFLGIASLGVLTFRVLLREGMQRRVAAFTLGPAFLFVASEWYASYFLEWTERAHPTVLDLYLYSFDASLHVQFSFLLGQLFARFHGFAVISLLIYIGLPVAIGLTYAGCLMRDKKNALPALIAFLIAGPLGAIFYNFFPALGPSHIFTKDFPWHPLSYEQVSRLFLEPVVVAGPRNAMPSLHAAWIFLVFWYARSLSLLEKTLAGVFVFFTLCATMGTGEHYFIDIIVAVPFSLLVVGLAELLPGRARASLVWPLAVGLGGTAAWFLALRFALKVFWASPMIPWAACMATLLLCFHARTQMLEAAPSLDPAPELLEDAPATVAEQT
jgi:hypothetical protein